MGDANGLRLASRSAGRAGDKELVRAAELHRAALNNPMSSRSPYLWAKANCYLGFDLERLGQRGQNAAHLEEAAAAFGKCLSILPTDSAEPFTLAARQDLAAVHAELARRR